MRYILGIDIGGTKTAIGLYSEGAELMEAASFPSEPELGAESLVERIGDTARKLAKDNNVDMGDACYAGIACPGPLDLKTGRIIYIATMGFRDVPIRDMIADELGIPVYLQNDANCAALAEALRGEGKGFENVTYITVSTGVGGGIVLNANLLDGGASAAAEIGHICTERNGRACGCGKKGCLEQYASGTAIASIASEKLGREIDAKNVFALARGGDSVCTQVVKQAADHLAFALGALWQIADPDIVVLGGSVIKDFDVLKPLVFDALERYVQPMSTREIRIAVSKMGGEQGMLGAALAAQKHFE